MKSRWRILVVDDEEAQRDSLAAWLREDGYRVQAVGSGERAIEEARKEPFAVYFVDLKMPPGMDGIETLRGLRAMDPEASVVIVTAYAAVDTAVAAIKEGAEEYVVKPFDPHEISLLAERLIRMRRLREENRILRERLRRRQAFHGITARSPRMQAVLELVRSVANLRSTVLVQGESGTGKEVVARAIHLAGSRKDRPFVAVPCAALAESLLESELFGHERGAFTGAAERRRGKFELADGGTLLLDEVGDVSPRLQAELLRVLQERRFFRVGGSEEVTVDVRVIAATHRDLREEVREGRFREDLYYRLNVITVQIPPLRERREDIPLLVEHFVARFAAEQGREPPAVADGALRRLLGHGWPGNVRELENAIERAMATNAGPELRIADFDFLAAAAEGAARDRVPGDLPLREIERRAIEATLRRTGGNVKAAAESLEIDRSTLYEKMRRYGVERPAANGRPGPEGEGESGDVHK
jgi:two-component system response regulator HydG